MVVPYCGLTLVCVMSQSCVGGVGLSREGDPGTEERCSVAPEDEIRTRAYSERARVALAATPKG